VYRIKLGLKISFSRGRTARRFIPMLCVEKFCIPLWNGYVFPAQSGAQGFTLSDTPLQVW
jgi:hypothetical protein